MVKVLQPTTRAEEYEFRAKYLKDEYHMAGDGPRATAFRIDKALRLIEFSPDDVVLDISPGKGLLFERIHSKVNSCYGIDVAPAMVERLKAKFAGYGNVAFETGPSSKLPYPDKFFTKILMTGAFCLQEEESECLQTLAEIRRVAKDSATIFISDIAIADESLVKPEHLSAVQRLRRRIRQDGPVEFLLNVKRYILWKVRVLLELEPVLVESTRGIWFSHERFVEMCQLNRLHAEGFQTQMVIGPSPTRNDYLIKPV